MATSAEKLSTILDLALTMARDGEENEAIMKALAKRELLPAKLLPKKKEATSIFASKQAEEVATRAKLALDPGAGSGKDGRYTLADINKLLETPKKKQVMMFSATMSADTRALCKKFMQDPMEVILHLNLINKSFYVNFPSGLH